MIAVKYQPQIEVCIEKGNVCINVTHDKYSQNGSVEFSLDHLQALIDALVSIDDVRDVE